MYSRRREDVRRLFECWCEVEPSTTDRPAWVTRKFPETYKDDDLQSVPKFAFPCKMEVTVVQHFSFVLTRLDGKWTYGFCRHDPQQSTAYVVLTYLPWHDIFFKFLNCIAQAARTSNLKEFLSAAYNQPVPDPDQLYELQFNSADVNPFTFNAPNLYELPKIPENRNLTEYYSAVDSECMLHVLAAMLTERRIIFTSKRIGRLSSCVQAANSLIYPMVWQQLFIPVLPMQLIDFIHAPMPFLIGVPEPVLKTVRISDLGEVVILNIDDNSVRTPFDDLQQMPPEVVTYLKKQLKNRPSLLGDGVSRAFLRTIVQLTKGYRDALEFREKITFNGDMFVESRPASYKPFIRSMLRLQTFQQFIEDRLYMLNSGTTFSDEFEKELAISSEHSSNKFKQQYREWTGQMRKEGTAFFRTVKDKANPAVKSAVKSVREGGKGVKSAYKGLRSKFRDNPVTSDGMTVYSAPRNGLRSAPDSPSSSRRPKTYAVPSRTYRKENSAYNLSTERSANTNVSPQSPQGPALSPPDLDLMKELQNHHLFKNLPVVDRSLKPTSSRRQEANTLPRQGPVPFLELHSSDNSIVPTGTLCIFDTPPSSNRSSLDSIQFHSISRDSTSYGSCNPDNSFLEEDSSSSSTMNSSDDCISKRRGVGQSTPLSNPPLPPPRPKVAMNCVGKSVGRELFVDKASGRSYTNVQEPTKVGGDLIRLDSTPDLQDFDPLSTKTNNLSNPIYTFYVPPNKNGSLKTSSNQNQNQLAPRETGLKFSQSATNIPNGFSIAQTSSEKQNDQDLLQEYGLDFTKFSICNKSVVNGVQQNGTNKHWTTFD